MTESFAGDLKEWMSAYIGVDIFVASSFPLRSEIGQRIAAIPGVKAVAPIRYFTVDWETAEGHEQINFMAIDPAAYAQVTRFVLSGNSVSQEEVVRRLKQGDAVLVSSVLAEKYDLQPGDFVQLRTRKGYKPFEVAAIVVDFYNQGLVMQGSWDDMRRYFRIKNASTFLVKVAEDEPAAGRTG